MDLKLLSLSIKVLEFEFSLFIYLQKLLGHQLRLNTLSTLLTSYRVDKINHVTHEYPRPSASRSRLHAWIH